MSFCKLNLVEDRQPKGVNLPLVAGPAARCYAVMRSGDPSMQCSSCQTDVSAGDRFCAACGAPVQLLCASCGRAHLVDARFCAECGTRLAMPDGSQPPARAERRNLSVMFCDLVGSTPLSSRLDPEDLGELIRELSIQCRGRYSDDLVALSPAMWVTDCWSILAGHKPGRPMRNAPSGQRSRSRPRLARCLIRGERLQVRIGIATGLVVVGESIGAGESQQQTAIGETPNRAARLQALAEPNSVVIDAATHQQLGRLFECRSLGAVAMKGLPAPVQTWVVQGESITKSRFEALHPATLTPLVSRNEEVDLLLRRWRQAMRGEGKVVLIAGEAGIGKSRLLAALEERLQGETYARLRCFCSPYHQDSPLHPIIGQLEHAAGFVRGDTARDKLNKLRTMLADTATSDEDVSVLAKLLSIPTDGVAAIAQVLAATPQGADIRSADRAACSPGTSTTGADAGGGFALGRSKLTRAV